MTDTKGFDLVNWFDYCKADVTLVTFSPELLKSLPSYGKVPGSYEGYPYDPTYSEAQLMIENIGEGVYHVCIRDYSCGWTRDLADGAYDYDYDEHPGWSDVERILDDLQKRIASGEIDLDKALLEYYTIGDDGLRMRPSHPKTKEDNMTGSMTEAQWKRLVGSAGKTFLGLSMGTIIERGAHQSDTARAAITEELFEKQDGWKDSDIGGTRTRVNAAVRLINAGEVKRTLESVIAGDYRVSGEAKRAAQTTLDAMGRDALRV